MTMLFQSGYRKLCKKLARELHHGKKTKFTNNNGGVAGVVSTKLNYRSKYSFASLSKVNDNNHEDNEATDNESMLEKMHCQRSSIPDSLILPSSSSSSSSPSPLSSIASLSASLLPAVDVQQCNSNEIVPSSISDCLPTLLEGCNTVTTMATSLHEQASEFSWYNMNAYSMDFVHYIHDCTGISYASSIVLITLLFRSCVVLPVSIWSLKQDPTVDLELKDAVKQYQSLHHSKAKAKIQKTLLENKITYLQQRSRQSFYRRMATPVTSIAGFVLIWSGLRDMVFYYPDDMSQGGLFWFVDLTQPDELAFLPLLSASLFVIMGEVGADTLGRPVKEYSTKWKWFWRCFRVAFFPLLINSSSAIFCYWIPSSATAVIQTIVLSQPSVLKALNIERTGNQGKLKDTVQFVDQNNMDHNNIVANAKQNNNSSSTNTTTNDTNNTFSSNFSPMPQNNILLSSTKQKKRMKKRKALSSKKKK